MIEASNLAKSFGSVRAVKGLTLTVPPGEIFCFLGPNGAGKTTTIKMMTGLLKPSGGGVRIDGIDMLQDPLEAKRRIGYIPDMPFLYERLTAREFFEFTGQLYGVARERIASDAEKYFALFGLLESRDVLTRELSHGMRQRLIYAATFLHDPKVLFVDEPLIGLDPYTIRLIKTLLVRKAQAGMTIFLTTHILSLAQDIGHRIGIILEGEMCELGTLEQLRATHGGGSLEDVFLKLTGGNRGEAVVLE